MLQGFWPVAITTLLADNPAVLLTMNCKLMKLLNLFEEPPRWFLLALIYATRAVFIAALVLAYLFWSYVRDGGGR
jgi:hypothetical protein